METEPREQSAKENTPVEVDFSGIERIQCQYCQDVGACSICTRGQQFAKEHPLDKVN